MSKETGEMSRGPFVELKLWDGDGSGVCRVTLIKQGRGGITFDGDQAYYPKDLKLIAEIHRWLGTGKIGPE